MEWLFGLMYTYPLVSYMNTKPIIDRLLAHNQTVDGGIIVKTLTAQATSLKRESRCFFPVSHLIYTVYQRKLNYDAPTYFKVGDFSLPVGGGSHYDYESIIEGAIISSDEDLSKMELMDQEYERVTYINNRAQLAAFVRQAKVDLRCFPVQLPLQVDYTPIKKLYLFKSEQLKLADVDRVRLIKEGTRRVKGLPFRKTVAAVATVGLGLTLWVKHKC